MRHALIVSTLMLASMAASAQTSSQYRVITAVELAKVCSAPASQADLATSLAFCHGFLAGAYQYFDTTVPAADRFVCLPNPSPSREQVAKRFVGWLKERPTLNNDGAVDALFRFAAEAYPCKR
jgi:Rap1a immunity proteins